MQPFVLFQFVSPHIWLARRSIRMQQTPLYTLSASCIHPTAVPMMFQED